MGKFIRRIIEGEMRYLELYGFRGTLFMIYCYVMTRLFYRDSRIIRFPFDIRGRKYIDLGKALTLGKYCRFEVFPHLMTEGDSIKLRIGKSVQMNDNVHICAMQSVEIGDNVLMASNIYISDNTHGFYNGIAAKQSSPNIPPINRPYFIAPVKIEKNAWVCQGCVINPGVTIGEGSIIGANSVVTHSIPPYSIAVGAPAKVIKHYDFNRACWVKQEN